MSEHELSENQKLFVADAEAQGFEVRYDYSGRFMYGETCPAIDVDSIGEFDTKANTRSDNMGLGFVIYCPN